MSFFEVSELSAAYGANAVLDGVSFRIESGMLAALLGENGSGKTTLLRSICGIQRHSGECLLNGQALEGLSARAIARLCSYIPQRSGIQIEISVLDAVLMGFNPRLRLLQQPDSEMIERAHAALKMVGLEQLCQRSYLSLSEGQKQLCILARTLVSDAKLLLLDEPESALDFRLRHRMLEILRGNLNEGTGASKCALVCLHDPVLALNSCDCVMLLCNGRISAVLQPMQDPLEEMEEKLSHIYGSISLHSIPNRSGGFRLVMLKEEPK